ncbi:MAG: hypothetical protein HC837_15015 [Chloroflexaceae bacterium]|nr:hypothetical protein [Chloroflexaceae bacterium]
MRQDSFNLTIGPLTVTLVSEPRLLSPLYQRYRPFATDVPSQLIIQLSLDSNERTLTPADTSASYCFTTHRFTSAHSTGQIDIAGGQAQLTLFAATAIADIDYALRAVYALLAFEQGCLLFHAAGVVKANRAYLFLGPSGTGKTTAARHSPDTLVLNDDLVLLSPDTDGWLAHATPFTNPSQIGSHGRHSAPIALICRLQPAQTVDLVRQTPATALANILASVILIPAHLEASPRLFQIARSLVQTVPLGRLSLRPDPSFWPVIQTFMQEQETP